MNQTEFMAELARRGFHAPVPDSSSDLTPREAEELLPDYLRAQLGGINRRTAHPKLESVLRENMSLDGIRQRAGMTMTDLTASVQYAMSILMIGRYASYAGQAEQFSRWIPVSDFRPVGLVTLDIAEPAEVPNDGELQKLNAKVSAAPRAGLLREYGGKMAFGRRVWQTYGQELGQGILDLASVFWSVEQRLVAAVLAAATVGTATGALTVAGLAAGAKALRTGLNPAGQPTGQAVHCVMVSPDSEVTARVLLAACGNWKPFLVVNPFLANTSYYLFANPQETAGLVRLTLRGNPEPRVYANTREPDKAEFALSHDVDYAITSAATSAIIRVTP